MNYRSSIDLLDLVGARVQSTVVDGKTVNAIIIPTDWNDIKVTMKDGAPSHAFLNKREWETSQKFREACMNNHKDDPDYVAPSHQISVAYSQEFEERAIASAERRLRADAEFMARGLSDEEIKKEAKYAVSNKSRIGYMTPLKRAEPVMYTGVAPAAQVVGEYVPPTGEVEVGDDLPF